MPSSRDLRVPLAYRPGRRTRPYSVFIAVADDLSARHLRPYGYARDTMPCLERRLETATLFLNCRTPVGWTLPACASIVTGQLPDDHGLSDHNRTFRQPKLGHYLGGEYHRYGIGNNGNVVSDEIPREYLEALGFKRRPAKWRFFGWNAGFDRYDWIHREDHERPFQLAREFLDARRGGGADGKPYFLFFHSNLVHDYHMGRPYYLDVGDWIGEEVHPGLLAVHDGPEVWRDPPQGISWELLARHMTAKYDCGIRSYDQQLETLLERVEFDNTIVILASDHGEGFDPERGRVHHCGRLHGDLIDVPLAIWLPPELRARYEPPRVETRHASTVDIVPTVLTLLGDAVAGFPGRFLFDLPVHRRITGVDQGYVYWNEDCVRESYDTASIELRFEETYPLKTIRARKNDTTREYAYNLAYDPLELDNLMAPPRGPIPGFEPITFVVAVNDRDELEHNFLASGVARSRHHEIRLVENRGNKSYSSISRLYSDALKEAAHDLVLFVHQDVYLPQGWEESFFRSLKALEAKDPGWGVVGAVGALPVRRGDPKELKGHWCDPSGYYRLLPLPREVESLDEQLLGVRKRHGVRFDPELPGFHCYGIDLSLSARDQGRASYAIDCFVWHKYKDPRGYLVERRERSEKIQRRWSGEFMEDFLPAAEYVERKWKKYLPFQTTSWTWGAG